MFMNLSKLSILVVEDVTPMRRLIIDILKTMGIGRVTGAENGEEGYKIYAREKPDLIITDWNMPGMSGMELTMKIRRDKSSPNRTIPIIMMTGFAAPKRIAEARNNGVSEFIVKPFKAGDIAKRIAHTVKSPRDFIAAGDFVGPDRRRKDDESFAGDKLRKKDTHQRIKATKALETKTGKGNLDNGAVTRSQSVIDNNKIDLAPLMERFLKDMAIGVQEIKETENPTKSSLSVLIDPVMQIKANARIFKYDLVGDLATTMLSFLETLNEVDNPVIEIIEANRKTLTHLVEKRMKGDGGAAGKALQTELESACKRYLNAKTKISQHKFKKKLEKE